MALNGDPVVQDDLSALSWVHDELRRSLDTAHKALRRYLKESGEGSDLDRVDPAVLRQARSQLHQSVGVLELVALGPAIELLRAAEAALQRLSAKTRLITPAAVDTIERGSFALLDYIGRRLAGKAVSPLALFPQYKALQELAGAIRIHPADLWPVPFTWRLLPAEAGLLPRHPDAGAIGEVESDLLALMRGAQPSVAARMSEVFAAIGAGTLQAAPHDRAHQQLATLWRLAAGFYEAQADGLLGPDVYSKRVGSQLLKQLRAGEDAEAAERLAHDLLYFCGQAAPRPGVPMSGGPGVRLAAVREVYGLRDAPPVDITVARLGRFDPAWMSQARKRVAAAKEVWSAVAGGDLARLPGLPEQFTLVADSLQRLYPDGGVLGQALQAAVQQTLASGAEPPAELAMEVATALLYVDASLDDADFDHPELVQRIHRLSQRIEQVRQQRDPGTLELWMEELYRRVSDRQTMGSVVAELRASLSEVEKNIDQYFRDPSQRSVLIPVPGQLGSMRGVLSVLGLDQASQAVLRMRDDVAALAETEVDPQRAIEAGTFDRLADNLGALSFLIDMVAVQPQMAKSLFRFDVHTGSLSAVMAREDRPSGFGELDARHEQAQRQAPRDTDALAVTLDFDRMVKQARVQQRAAHPEQGRQGLPLMHLDEPPTQPHGVHPTSADVGSTLRFDRGTDIATVRLERPTEIDDERTIQLPRRHLDDEAKTIQLERRPTPADEGQGATQPHFPSAWGDDDRTLQIPRAAAFDDDQATTIQLPRRDTPAAQPPGHAATVPAPMPPAAPLVDSGLEDDPEMREIFLEEAAEVLQSAGEGLQALQIRHDDHAAMTTVRRAFHTLKGSARMVGLRRFGEASWACEQLYNTRLAEHHGADTDLREFTAEALAYIGDWVSALTAGDASAFDPDVVAHPADALRISHRRLPLGAVLPAEPVADATLPAPAEALPEAQALAPAAPTAPAAPAIPAAGAAPTALPPLPSGLPLPAFDLGLMAGEGLAAVEPADLTPAPAAALPGLLERVPDLPTAADLDFSLAPALDDDTSAAPLLPLEAAAPAPLAQPEAIELTLPDLDLASLDGGAAALPSADALNGAATDPLPLPEAIEAIETVAAAEAIELTDLLLPAEADLAPTQPLPGVPAGPALDVLVEPPAPMDATLPLPAPDAVPDLVLDLDTLAAEPAATPQPTPVAEPEPVLAAEPEEAFKQIGPLRIGIPLFNIYLNEADELSRRLGVELAEWSHELHRPVGETAVALAHSLAGSSGTVGYADLSQLARALEHALERAQDRGHGHADEAALFTRGGEEIRRLLHLFAAGFLNAPEAELLQQLQDAAHAAPEPALTDLGALDGAEPTAPGELPALAQADQDAPAELAPATQPVAPVAADLPDLPAAPAIAEVAEVAEAAMPAPVVPSTVVPVVPAELGRAALLPFTALPEAAAPVATPLRDAGPGLDDEIDAVDSLDEELFPVFVEEGLELLPQLHGRLRDWSQRPGDGAAASACMRSLHTLKGSSRLAGAMHLGEMAHRLESAVARQAARGAAATAADIEPLIAYTDLLEAHFDRLRGVARSDESLDTRFTMPALLAELPAAVPVARQPVAPVQPAAMPAPAPRVGPAAGGAPSRRIDWRQFQAAGVSAATAPQADRSSAATAAQHGSVRVRVPLLDRLVNQAGEVSFSRTRIETDLRQFKGALVDLNENLERLRSQLRDIELQAESQIGSRLEAARAAAQQFDPLEMDRFTRFQELTRMMVESVSDVATVQRGLQRTLQSTEDALAHQARMTRDMQDDLLRTRMVEFEGLSERLYRVVRQAAKETGKPVRLDIVGGSIEIDRGVLDRMTPAFEHLLRNSVVHGIEPAAERAAAGKDATGTITLAVSQLGNEVAVDVRDDGGGLHLDKIRERALALGLLAPDATPDDGELANLVFQPGFTTAAALTDLAGRGVGMDVVRTDVNAMGGRIETASAPGQGASFKLVLPLTTAVTQVVMLRCGERTVAVPSTLVETVKRIPADELAQAYERGLAAHAGRELPFFWLDSLLQGSPRGTLGGRSGQSVVVRSADQRIVLHVDDVLGNQEVVIKHLGPQLARLPGMVGMTLLPSGLPAPIYNPVALATLYGEHARAQATESQREARRAAADARPAPVVAQAPMVLVVDDSLTVRRVTQRLLEREGYRVTVAKDGLDALEKLTGELPSVILSDIEMPRMDGFDLVRNLRSDEQLTRLPVIMITSRIAQKHRDYAAELGVNHYLGKPYAEDELLALVARYARSGVAAAA
ncbi:hybrid sensor histidine kinase/response regulator [Aquabacterium sp. OR-4]|uniref:hybrid sensor histidine kinase/response regulator n=1 Tax=Aquabacterium sp. OR-4 TaxID=2978127 RepID=UPI0028C9CBB2|nr:Hpt domain-containing protein [Aquabacterium sp. OR-4]MDT7834414.1 Hpt domain-containing protein [Aquabacterium sp. OR-4]